MGVSAVHISNVFVKSRLIQSEYGEEFYKRTLKETKKSLDQIFELAHNKDFLFITGNFFEEELVSLSLLKDLSKKFEALKNTQVVIVDGKRDSNQDIHAYYNVINWPNNVHIINTAIDQFEFDQVVVSGLSWHEKFTSEKINAIQAHPKKLNIFLANIEEKEESFALVQSDLVSKFDAVLIGYDLENKADGIVSYCGGIIPVPSADSDQKHGAIEVVTTSHSTSFRLQPVSDMVYRVINVEVTPLMDEYEYYGAIESALKDVPSEEIVEVLITGQHNKNVHPLFEDIEDRVKKYLEFYFIHDISLSEFNVDSIRNDNRHNIIGLFIDHVNAMDIPKTKARDLLYEGLDLFMNEKVMK